MSGPATARETAPAPAARTVLLTHPSSELYGSDRMLLESLHGVLDAGLGAVLALPGPGPLADAARQAGARVEFVDVPVLRKSAGSLRGLVTLAVQAIRSARPALRLLRSVRPSVVYVSTLTTPTWPLLGRLVSPLGVPVVVHVHEAESRASRPVQVLMTLPLRAAAAVLVNSRYALDILLGAQGALVDRCQVVLNGVAGPPDEPALPGPEPSGPESSGALRVLYLGRISERKGVAVLLDAVGHVVEAGTDVRLDLVGDVFADHAAFGARVEAATAAPPLAGRVNLRGFSRDIWSHLRACDVLVVPSVLPEPFGNTAVEGVLAARPVIASAVGGLPQALEGVGSARLVPAGDSRALAAALQETLRDLPARQALALADAPAARARFAPQRYRDAVVAALLAAAGDDAGARDAAVGRAVDGAAHGDHPR